MTTPLPVPFYAYFIEEAMKDVFDTDITYFFTWVPNPARYPTSSPSEQYKILLDLVFFKVKKMFGSFCFTPELTEAGNIHIHGFYVIKKLSMYYKWFLPKLKALGHLKVERIKMRWAVVNYCSKDVDLMNEIVDPFLPVPLTHLNIEYYEKLNRLTKKKLRLMLHKKAFPVPGTVRKFKKTDLTKMFDMMIDEVDPSSSIDSMESDD